MELKVKRGKTSLDNRASLLVVAIASGEEEEGADVSVSIWELICRRV